MRGSFRRLNNTPCLHSAKTFLENGILQRLEKGNKGAEEKKPNARNLNAFIQGQKRYVTSSGKRKRRAWTYEVFRSDSDSQKHENHEVEQENGLQAKRRRKNLPREASSGVFFHVVAPRGC